MGCDKGVEKCCCRQLVTVSYSRFLKLPSRMEISGQIDGREGDECTNWLVWWKPTFHPLNLPHLRTWDIQSFSLDYRVRVAMTALSHCMAPPLSKILGIWIAPPFPSTTAIFVCCVFYLKRPVLRDDLDTQKQTLEQWPKLWEYFM